MGVPGDVHETGRWSLDHLFLDQDGIPTFVECKRSDDTRARREVVAQMLDYAANGIEYWSLDRLRQSATETAQKQDMDLDQMILELLQSDDEEMVEQYWQIVETNLRSGKVRLIFVLDHASRELRRLVEFLNEKMTDVEVLIVEIRQFLGIDQTALVPRVLGITEQARNKQTSIAKAKQPLQRADLPTTCSPVAAQLFTTVVDLAEERNYLVRWNPETVAIRAAHPQTGQGMTFVQCWVYDATLNFYFGELKLPEQQALPLRQELLQTGLFTKSGQHTLKGIPISDANAQAILDAYRFILDRIDALMQDTTLWLKQPQP
jgi:hypothetical protein